MYDVIGPRQGIFCPSLSTALLHWIHLKLKLGKWRKIRNCFYVHVYWGTGSSAPAGNILDHLSCISKPYFWRHGNVSLMCNITVYVYCLYLSVILLCLHIEAPLWLFKWWDQIHFYMFAATHLCFGRSRNAGFTFEHRWATSYRRSFFLIIH